MYYLANDLYSATLSSGYTVGDTTLYVTAVPTNVPTIVTLGKGTDNETTFTVTGKTSNSLTGVARLRGANVNLDTATPVTCLNNQDFINQFEHAVATPETLKDVLYAADSGATDAYAITLDPAPTAYVEGMLVAFKANTANTGAATLNVNALGAKTIKRNHDQDLADNDIEMGSLVLVQYDGTNFQLLSATANFSQSAISVDVISEKTANAGVTIDGLSIKDGGALRSKLITLTRDCAGATEDVAYTGVGFTPSAIIFVGSINGTTVQTVGFTDSSKTNNCNVWSYNGGSASPEGAQCMKFYTAGGAEQRAVVKSFDADGFTITWTKYNSPSGTAVIFALCLK